MVSFSLSSTLPAPCALLIEMHLSPPLLPNCGAGRSATALSVVQSVPRKQIFNILNRSECP
jgi:hypothetical protein